MKQTTSILIIILSIFLPNVSCRHSKPSEKAEIFLQAIEKRQTSFKQTDSLLAYRLDLFTAEQKYDFTSSQLLRLKQIQLRECAPYNEELASRLIAETEKLAQSANNDSLLCAVRWNIFRVYRSFNDTTAAQKVLQQQEPLVRQLYGKEKLTPYYYAMAFIFHYHNKSDKYLYWLQKARPEKAQLLHSWYNTICEAYLNAGHYNEAILYADSAFASANQHTQGNTVADIVKGEALIQLFRTKEALEWYSSTMQSIDNFRKKSGISSYSLNQHQIIFQYASLLNNTGKQQEAICQLEKINAISFPMLLGKNNEDVRERSVATARLLADCYRSIGQKQKFQLHTRQADSLQFALNKMRLVTKDQKTGEELKNHLLKEQLEQLLADNRGAHKTQYILLGIIVLLVSIIIAGLYWWQKRQKRLRQLFDLLANRHTLWLKQHFPERVISNQKLLSIETDNIAAPGQPFIQEESNPNNFHLLYQKVLLIMQKEKPFLDPNLDLVALSRNVATNRTMLSTTLNRKTGMNFSNWLAEYRVNYLIEQLPHHIGKSIDELYPLAGFSSRTSFFRQFRQVTGMTPNQYLTRRSKLDNPNS